MRLIGWLPIFHVNSLHNTSKKIPEILEKIRYESQIKLRCIINKTSNILQVYVQLIRKTNGIKDTHTIKRIQDCKIFTLTSADYAKNYILYTLTNIQSTSNN